MPKLRIAIVDMGSNTLKFSVTEIDASRQETIVAQRADTVRLAAGLAQGAAIAPDRIALAVKSMIEFDQFAEQAGASVRLCVGTAALRMASNGAQVVSLIEQATRWRVRIIDGEDEAQLAFRGLVQFLDPLGRYLVLDIGGGSTEAILVEQRAIVSLQSLPIGSGTLSDSCFTSDPPGMEALENARSLAIDVLSTSSVLASAAGAVLILSGGNGVFLRDLVTKRSMPDAFHPAKFQRLVDWLATHDADSFASDIGIVVERARMLPAGAAIALAAITIAQPIGLEARASGIRGGLIAEWLSTHPLGA